ncbi:hypothetical protein [Streptomyces sp. NPDC051569]|uniref:hypothetical protein n=1 Tax=Streptomyces sp. NPDC051569 TaxID=3365661 RepID=UPI00378C9FD0
MFRGYEWPHIVGISKTTEVPAPPHWVDHDLVFARDGFKLYRGEAGGPQDPEEVSARWRTLRNRLHLPEDFRIHDWRHSKVTYDLEAGENPVEVSAGVRHHSPGCTMARCGLSRETERGGRPLPDRADSACHPFLTWGFAGLLVTPPPSNAKDPTRSGVFAGVRGGT